eukprot:CAMPEP_0197069122 /NCGR_PEP_ID=MMETSP1384-20130603/191030_1 /TAXON_ID=29189 /ORGANISM="Ammonia sp." /LENGTH=205 /DNA_ID=CAMNT_0042507083 /DNA_START=153 /DNA_END=766 /DNA_ORIENTATION=+
MSRSVIGSEANTNNPAIIVDFIHTVMDTWWKVSEQLNRSTAFALVTFSTDEEVQFDLNTAWNLTQYLQQIDAFFGAEKFRGQTNTLGALQETVNVFRSSQHYEEGEWQRLAVLVTDGEPTIEPLWAYYGPNPCEAEYRIAEQYRELDAFLWAGLIGANIHPEFLDCFQASLSTIKSVNDYQSLGGEISGVVGHVECAHSHPVTTT